jgi:RNA recognition motif-containing protein
MRLYVGNIPWGATEQELHELFNEFGPCSTRIIKDRETQKSRGFGFVEYEDPDNAPAAMESLHGTSFQGRDLVVNQAREREQRSGGGNGHHRHDNNNKKRRRNRDR